MMRGHKSPKNFKGVTLIELTVVITLLVALSAIGFVGARAYTDYNKGRAAGAALQEVYAAQKMYLADHPTMTPADLWEKDTLLVPYLDNVGKFNISGDRLQWPDKNGTMRSINCSEMPPFMQGGDRDTPYDPSGNLADNLWDAGEE